ncbi:NB-ARC domain-containing protein [Asanoa sp. NPDC049518]|uniref:NB-ARC domain-containing protein n=1 Tax=unclassified Asanoa TaxID=2685164 RepID=UPI00343B9F53
MTGNRDVVRRWFRRNRIRAAAAFTGLAGFGGVVAGSDDITPKIICFGIVVGLAASVPVVLLEPTLRALNANRPRPADEPAGPVENVPPPDDVRPLPRARRTVPEPLSTFRGRERELATLVDLHDRERSRRQEDKQTLGAVIIPIWGKPGVGKSALAQELSRRLADRYPDGVYYLNFGTAGGARPPAEILQAFLLELGADKERIPPDAPERASLFRSMTAQTRCLFVFDAARYPDQVLSVLPTEPGCAVIITSRRHLDLAVDATDGLDAPLAEPPIDEALDILSAVSDVSWEQEPEQAVEVVELCGRLPSAIRSAGERAALDGTDLRHVADLLRPRDSRLEWLDRAGRGVRERIQSEFRRLTEPEQHALCLLTLVDSPTFVPWVLRPLLNVSQTEAQNLVAALGAAQLLDSAGTDTPSGLARYQFNPLIRLFAEKHLPSTGLSTQQVAAADARLVDAYLELVDLVLGAIDDRYTSRREPHWSPGESIAKRIGALPDHGVRAAHAVLARAVPIANGLGDHGIAWRIAASLRGCVSETARVVPPERLYDCALRSAKADDDETGELDVKLAEAAHLTALERYDAAFRRLHDVITAVAPDAGPRLRGRRARAHRQKGEALLQLGAYHDAVLAVTEALSLAGEAGDSQEEQLARLLLAENHRVPSPYPTYDDMLEGRLSDAVHFRGLLGLSEAARRRRRWASAADYLGSAQRLVAGDVRKSAAVDYRLARLYIGKWQHEHPEATLPLAEPLIEPTTGPEPRLAIQHAAQAAHAFRLMSNPVGAIRARAQVIRGLTTAGHLISAEQLCHTLWTTITTEPAVTATVRDPILARYARAHGELLLRLGDLDAAWRILSHAATLYAANDDWASHREIWGVLTTAQRTIGYPRNRPPSHVERALEDAVARAGRREAAMVVHVPTQPNGSRERTPHRD